jgi:hypothetical protein
MPINHNQLSIGTVYSTVNGQHRVILGCDSQGRVVYASKSGLITSQTYNRKISCQTARFCKNCNAIVGKMPLPQLQLVIQNVNAATVLSKGLGCFSIA